MIILVGEWGEVKYDTGCNIELTVCFVLFFIAKAVCCYYLHSVHWVGNELSVMESYVVPNCYCRQWQVCGPSVGGCNRRKRPAKLLGLRRLTDRWQRTAAFDQLIPITRPLNGSVKWVHNGEVALERMFHVTESWNGFWYVFIVEGADFRTGRSQDTRCLSKLNTKWCTSILIVRPVQHKPLLLSDMCCTPRCSHKYRHDDVNRHLFSESTWRSSHTLNPSVLEPVLSCC